MALCCRLWTSSAGAARARIFPWLERVPDLPVNAPAFFSSRHESQRRCVMQIYYEGEQVSMFDQDGFYGRTSRARSRAERRRAKTSGSFWRRYSESVSIPYQFLDLTPGHGDLLGEPYWEIRSPLRGEHSTLNTGESPRGVVESSLGKNDCRSRQLRQLLNSVGQDMRQAHQSRRGEWPRCLSPAY